MKVEDVGFAANLCEAIKKKNVFAVIQGKCINEAKHNRTDIEIHILCHGTD